MLRPARFSAKYACSMAFCSLLAAVCTLTACQDYPFETREPRRLEAQTIREVVSTVRPTDILFVIDNSGSMTDELTNLRNNIEVFINILAESANDYQIGFITPDIECNIPGTRDCSIGGTSASCCAINPPECFDQDLDGDTTLDSTDCDGGRLRSADGVNRVFARPAPEDVDDWLSDVRATIEALGCQGSGYEAGLEAARVALLCAADSTDCPSAAVAQLNSGFLRPEANLVIAFITDEDDCSFMEHARYQRPDGSSAGEQAAKLCSPTECYAYLGEDLDFDVDGVMDWADRDASAGAQRYYCNGVSGPGRVVNPPLPDPVGDFLDDIASVKGGDISRIRAAAILGSVQDQNSPFGFAKSACVRSGTGASPGCGCWANGGPLYCDVTSHAGLDDDRTPSRSEPILSCVGCSGDGECLGTVAGFPTCDPTQSVCSAPDQGGCQAMGGGRYVDFMQELATRQTAAGVPPVALVDTICQFDYSSTLRAIADLVNFDSCIALGMNVPVTDDVQVDDLLQLSYEGARLRLVPKGSAQSGYSFDPAKPSEICLEGDLTKDVGDRIEIFLIESVQ